MPASAWLVLIVALPAALAWGNLLLARATGGTDAADPAEPPPPAATGAVASPADDGRRNDAASARPGSPPPARPADAPAPIRPFAQPAPMLPPGFPPELLPPADERPPDRVAVDGRITEHTVTAAMVRNALDRGVAWLRKRRGRDGHWPMQSFEGGATGIALLALVTAGAGAEDPDVDRGVRALLGVPNHHTYVVALKLAALAAIDPRGYAAEIRKCADDLAAGQCTDGSWSYWSPTPKNVRVAAGDGSNTQFALLALHEARAAGIPVPKEVFAKADAWWRGAINADGGWGYAGRGDDTRPTMTAAGVASLFITAGGTAVHSRERGWLDGAAADCGRLAADIHLEAGLHRLQRDVGELLAGRSRGGAGYGLYAAERVGMLLGMRTLGDADWYRRGAARLVATQKPDGSWPGSPDSETALAILFLAKGRAPVVVQKLRWDGEWNPDPADLRNLLAFAARRRVFDRPVTWQSVDVDARDADFDAAPLLVVTGHRFPDLTDAQVARLRGFVERGGTLLAEACCSRPEFADGFRSFAARGWPGAKLQPLDGGHPAYRVVFDVRADRAPLSGLETGCRTGVIFSGRDLSCLWQQNAHEDAALVVPGLTAMRLGCNLLAYAAGRETLRERLETVELPDRPTAVARLPVRGAVSFARLQHAGDWSVCREAVPNLSVLLRDAAGVDVASRPTDLRPDDDALFGHPVAVLAGHTRFELTAVEAAGLRRYLERGGFLISEACCGRAAFDGSLRSAMERVLPAGGRLVPVPADHPLITGRVGAAKFGFDLTDARHRPGGFREGEPVPRGPVLWMAEIDGRVAAVHSATGFGCGLDGMACRNCRGLEAADARRLAVNLVLYGLSR